MLNLVTLNENNQPTTTSKQIADVFEKEHKNILSAINSLDIPDNFRGLNFKLSKYQSQNRNGQILPCYEITRDGFTLLAMGFTGKKAMEWKIKFIEAFNAMEKALKVGTPAPVDMKAIGGVVKKCAAVAVREEVKQVVAETIREEVRDMALDVVLSAERFKPLHEVSDETMMNCLYGWYSTRHHKLLDVVKELDEENGRLKSQMAMIKKVVA